MQRTADREGLMSPRDSGLCCTATAGREAARRRAAGAKLIGVGPGGGLGCARALVVRGGLN